MLDFSRFRAVLLDMDGTIYRGDERLPGVNRFLELLRERGVAYACVTNNSTTSAANYEHKLAAMDIVMPAAQIITSAGATRQYLEGVAPKGTRMYVVGMAGLHEALFGDGYYLLDEQTPAFVVAGLDRTFTYEKAMIANRGIRNGATFVGTNPDTSLPTESGIVPGAGSILAMIQAASGARPLVIGKPAPTMLDMAAKQLGADASTTLVVGDRLDTDIAGAVAANMASVLVLTGVSGREEAENGPTRPDLVLDSMVELTDLWAKS